MYLKTMSSLHELPDLISRQEPDFKLRTAVVLNQVNSAAGEVVQSGSPFLDG